MFKRSFGTMTDLLLTSGPRPSVVPAALVRRRTRSVLHRPRRQRTGARLRLLRGGTGKANGQPSCSPAASGIGGATHFYGFDPRIKSTKALAVSAAAIAGLAPEAHHNLRAASARAISFRTPYLWKPPRSLRQVPPAPSVHVHNNPTSDSVPRESRRAGPEAARSDRDIRNAVPVFALPEERDPR